MAASATIDELIAFNDELLALSRAGVPLEGPLLAGERSSRGRWRRVAQAVGEELERGVPLVEALKSPGAALPGPYRAVVAAGLRAGRLPAALEGVGRYARAYADLRRKVGLAALYPLLVLSLGYVLFVLFLLGLVPRMQEAFESLRIPDLGLLAFLERLGRSIGVWGFVVPMLLALAVIVWLWISTARRFGHLSGLAALPWMGDVLRSWRTANFSGWLGLLIEQGVPLDQSLELAGEATGDSRLARSAREVAAELRLGQPLAWSLQRHGRALHPWLRWQLAAVSDERRLAAGLARTADAFTSKAERQAETIRVVLPALLMLGVGGATVAFCVLSLFVPWSVLLRGLGADHS
jgi:type II secretory pathway component PulF